MFKELVVLPDERISVGIDESTGKYCLAIPVSNGLAEYSEFYVIEQNEFEALTRSLDPVRAIARLSRERKNDSRLLLSPGRIRGEPV